ncbi:MAG: hydroxymethylglutaryl-CoA lyase [Alphaproteobacteria bacterium]|nr:hydroxymethylglutaryl-CoA lyase [Alphaproteobacteria bacterium]
MMNAVELVEVSARDGLQNEPEHLSTEQKLELISRSVAAGLRRMEVASFVNPKKVPQMADAAEVMAGLPKNDGVTYIALALNRRGFERAAEAGAREVNFVLAASDAFAMRNSGAPMLGLVDALTEVTALATGANIRVSATISVAFGCPFEGEAPAETVNDLVRRAADAGVFEVALADTIGVGVPSQVRELFGKAKASAPQVQLRAHFHNTRNTALANALAAYECGVKVIDGSLAGVGGCPFAPGAAGNVPTEDLVYLFERMGISTGVDLAGAIDTAKFIGAALGKVTPGMVSKAGGFPVRG